jgi:PAS domain S-box-containing protein
MPKQPVATRLREQHRLTVDFGTAALRATSVAALLEEACRVAAKGLSVKLAKALRFDPHAEALVFAAAVGWEESERDSLKFDVDEESPPGYAFLSGRPAVSSHLGAESGFRTPPVFAKYGITKTINVPIRGLPSFFGILEVDGTRGDNFIETDVVFLEAIANIVALARERLDIEGENGLSDAYLSGILTSSSDCIVVVSTKGNIDFVNDCARAQLASSNPVGTAFVDMWPEEHRAQVRDALHAAVNNQPSRFEAPCLTRDGELRWWDVAATPVSRDSKSVESVACASRDVTERHDHAQRLSHLLAIQKSELSNSSLMAREVHHRVRNSLQLVQTLLALQATLTGNPDVSDQLHSAASRVATVGAIHHRLYEEDASQHIDAARYLEKLVSDFRKLAPDRSISLSADGIDLPAPRMTALGLIIAELITNAVKYGTGDIRLALAKESDVLRLTVEDDGAGFPTEFPSSRGTGLGMRLIQSYSKLGAEAVQVDRSVPYSRIIVRFRAN